MRAAWWAVIAIVAWGFVPPSAEVAAGARQTAADAPTAHTDAPPPEIASRLQTLRPRLVFEENVGQHDAAARFVARAGGFDAWFGDGEVVLDVQASPDVRDVLRMRVSGASTVPLGGAILVGKSNYFLGNDPAKWVTGAPHHDGVTYTGVAPGVDLTWRSAPDANLEYVLTAEPGADAERFEIEFDGATSLHVSRDGDLVVTTANAALRHSRPVAWQETGGGRRAVACRFDLRGGDRVGFRVGEHDASLPLVVDPEIVASVVVDPQTSIRNFALDGAGALWVAGQSKALTYPTVGSSVQSSVAGYYDVTVFKLRTSDLATVVSTYLGGASYERAYCIAAGADGAAYVGGTTSSADFPTLSACQSSSAGPTRTGASTNEGDEGFLFKLASSGASLGYSTYLGGSSTEYLNRVVVDANGAATVSGYTQSTDFPVASAYQSKIGGQIDAFVARFSASGSSLTFSTYFGGTGNEIAHGLALDSSGNVVIAGGTIVTGSGIPATSGAFLTSPAGGVADAYVAKFARGGSSLLWATYLGGTGDDWAGDVRIDSADAVYVLGQTSSGDFPTTAGAYQPSNSGFGEDSVVEDVYVAKLRSDGSALHWATYWGGNGEDLKYTKCNLSVAGDGSVWFAGPTGSTNIPLVSDFGASSSSGGCIVRFSSSGASLLFCTYTSTSFGVPSGVATDASGYTYVCSTTNPGGYSEGVSGTVLKLAPATPTTPATFSATPVSDRSVRLDWAETVVEGGEFEIERAPAGGAFSQVATPGATAVTYTDSTASGETSYDYRLRGTNVSGSSAWTTPVRVTTGPIAPTGFTAAAQTNTRVALAWTDRASTETGFEVERRTATGTLWTRVGTPVKNATSFTDSAAPPESSLVYRVRAVSAGAPSEWTPEVTVKTGPTDPAAKTSRNSPDGKPSFTWDDLSLAEKGYEVQRAPGFPGVAWATIALLPADTTSFDDATAEPETTYSYRVRAFNDDGVSDWVDLGHLTTPPYAPTDLVATALSPSRVFVTWTDAAKAEQGYEVKRSRAGVAGAVDLADLSADADEFLDASASQEGEYTYRVRTFNQHGTSRWSEVTVTTPSALVVKAAKVKRGKGKKPKPTTFTATGEFDVAGAGLDLAGAATVSVGDVTFDLAALTESKGKFRYGDGTLHLELTPSKQGTSRVAFKLTVTGAAADALPRDGEATLRFASGDYAAMGVVTLRADAFSLGKGRIVDPPLIVSSLSARLAGEGRDALTAKAWFDASEGVPATQPDVLLRLRYFEFRAPGADFKGKGTKRTYVLRSGTGSAAGTRKVVIDWAKGTIAVTLTGVTIGSFEKGPIDVPFTLSLGAMSASDTLGVVCTGKSLRY